MFVWQVNSQMKKKNRAGWLAMLVLGSLITGNSQKVTVSREINIRNNYSYDILPNIGSNTILYNDKGIEHQFEIYDANLRYKSTVTPEFEKKNIQPIGLLSQDSSIYYFYTYREDEFLVTKGLRFDQFIQVADTLTLSVKEKKFISSNPRFAHSDDQSKVLIFTPDDKKINLKLVDISSFTLLYDFNLTVEGINLKSDFEKLVVSNDGQVYIAARPSSFWNKAESNGFSIIRIKNKEDVAVHHFSPESDDIVQLMLDADNANQRIVLAGFTTTGDETRANGYFGFSIDPETLPDDAEILINRFTPEFIADITGNKPGKMKELHDFSIKHLVVRQDGGVILVCEQVREFIRRGQMNVPGQFGNNFGMRGLIDYYHEDVLLLANYPDGKEHWQKVLFKKQFSQDDNAIYSSFCLFKTPSRLHLIYNDEIKNNNTVSEYVIDPLGNAERKSVLSTEYQNLRLRFKEAIQTGANTLIVPSEKNWKINLVKIEY
jgi:hypothetical protein